MVVRADDGILLDSNGIVLGLCIGLNAPCRQYISTVLRDLAARNRNIVIFRRRFSATADYSSDFAAAHRHAVALGRAA